MKKVLEFVFCTCVLLLLFSCKNATTAEKFTVTYKVYGGDGWEVMSNARVDKDGEFDSAKVPDNAKIDYSGRKYSFAGWTAKDLSSANPSTASGTLYSGAVVADMTVYAVYARADALVTYKYWNGTEWAQLGEVQKVDLNTMFDDGRKPDDVVGDYSEKHYKFKGWTSADNSSNNPSNTTGEMYSGAVSTDMTVYALYSQVCKVDYKYWDGTAWAQLGEPEYVEPNSAFVRTRKPASLVTKCKIPPKTYNYAFQFREDSWTDADVSANTAEYTASIPTSFTGEVTQDMTVYAIYDKIKDFVYVEKGKSPTKGEASRTESDYLPMDYDFLICDHEVTQAEYNRYDSSHVAYFSSTGSGKGKVSGSTDNLPVEMVDWYDAVEYCNWLSGQEGLASYYTVNKTTGSDTNNTSSSDTKKWLVTVNENANGYRLPLEWEWEYAARGGKKGKGCTYSGSNTFDSVAWHSTNSSSKTHDVRGKSANELGLYDMSGNVLEWCWDRYSSGMTLGGAVSGSYRIKRGGGWGGTANTCEVSNRNYDNPDSSGSGMGFRVVRSCPIGLI